MEQIWLVCHLQTEGSDIVLWQLVDTHQPSGDMQSAALSWCLLALHFYKFLAISPSADNKWRVKVGVPYIMTGRQKSETAGAAQLADLVGNKGMRN